MAIDLLLVPLLLWIAIEDWRRYRIRNVAVAILAVGVAATLFDGRHASLVPVLIFAAIAAACLVGAFAMGWIGGGDAKLLALALLHVGPAGAAVFAVLLLVLVVLHAAGAMVGMLPSRLVGGRRQIPYGPSVAAAWIGTIALSRGIG